MKAVFNDWGLIDYKEAWDKQQAIFDSVLLYKKNKSDDVPHRIIFCEHPHVYTLGRNGDENNLLIQGDFLKRIHASYYKIDRGGDITYHGPGQIVGYPIIDLEEAKLSLKEYIFQMEQGIIDTLKEYGISAYRLDGATGVWLDVGNSSVRKICAIGVRASRYVTMHGFAFNINTNLDYFNYINPCGFVDKGVTSLSKELGKSIDIEEVKRVLKLKLYHTFNIEE
ncbi:MAG: lipoyl(octanoyl) transferase LipB [Bacteroidales bacterium]|nr:lipoyl(octanoyl) transferase LipB [Bacteroidales bacterium]